MADIVGTLATEKVLSGSLNAILGKDGASAYEIALQNGFEGSVTEWLESLKGADGSTGATGKDGNDGKDGIDGLSAYQVWLSVGNTGTEADFLASLKGAKGDKGEQGIQGIQGEKGDKGADGTMTFEELTPEQKASLKGDKGDKGEQGVQGIQGVKGDKGDTGASGKDGSAGVGIKTVTQTTTSTADGGNNVITVTKTDGTTSTFTVKNGSKGSTGAKGDTGNSGVYLGSGDMPADCNVQIDPEGEALDLSTYATKQYVDDAIASSGGGTGGGVSKEYVDNEIETLRHEVVTTDRIEPLEADVETIKQGYVTVEYVNEKTQNIPAIEEDIEILKDDAETFKENFEVISTSYATKKYVNDAIASGGGGTGGGGVSSWNDLTDKPFYDEGTKTATLDYANPPAVGIDFGGLFLGKVTDDILTADYINGAKLSLSFTADDMVTDVSQELNTDTITGISFPFGTIYRFDDENFMCMVVVATQSGEFDLFGNGSLINVPETGTYLSFVHYSAVTNSISLTYTLLKTLEAKYLEIINKTEDVSILTEQEFSFTAAEDGTYQAMAGATPLTVGKTYKVVWDGAEYVYEAINVDGAILIGDFLASNPFVIGLVEGSTMIATSNTSATHTISIIEVGGYEIKQEYLPASLYTEIDQRIENYINEALGGDY